MKLNDIFEQTFNGNTVRFQLVELRPNRLTIITLGIEPPIRRSGGILITALPKVALATFVDGGHITTKKGDDWIKRFTMDIFKKIKARRVALHYLNSCKELNQKDAEAIVDRLDKKIHYWEIEYLPAVVRWVRNGEIDLENEDDIIQLKKLLGSFRIYSLKRDRGEVRCLEYKLAFDGICFKRLEVGKLSACLWTMKDVKEALQPLT